MESTQPVMLARLGHGTGEDVLLSALVTSEHDGGRRVCTAVQVVDVRVLPLQGEHDKLFGAGFTNSYHALKDRADGPVKLFVDVSNSTAYKPPKQRYITDRIQRLQILQGQQSFEHRGACKAIGRKFLLSSAVPQLHALEVAPSEHADRLQKAVKEMTERPPVASADDDAVLESASTQDNLALAGVLLLFLAHSNTVLGPSGGKMRQPDVVVW